MKRFAAFILAVLIVTLGLTGCTGEKYVLLNKINDDLEKMNRSITTGQVDITAHTSGLSKLLKASGSQDVKLEGETESYTLKYTVKSDKEAVLSIYTVEVTGGGNTFNFDGYISKNNICISLDSYETMFSQIAFITGDTDGNIQYIKKALQKLKDEGYQYCALASAELPEEMPSVTTKDILPNFSDGDRFIETKDNHVLISGNLQDLLYVASGMFNYLAENLPEKLLSYMQIENENDAKDSFNSVAEALNQLDDNVVYSEMLQESTMDIDISEKEDQSVVTDFNCNISYQNDKVMTVKGNSTAKALDEPIAVSGDVKIATAEEIDNLMVKYAIAENKPVAARIFWEEGSDDAIFILDTASDSFTLSTNCKLIDDRIYLPLRSITERCGYDVEWDGSRAFAIVDENKIDMTGLLIDDKTYVKVRDFEKLGVTVDYEQEGSSCTATLNFK